MIIQFIEMLLLTAIVIDFGMRVFKYARTGKPEYKHKHFAILNDIREDLLK